MVLDLSSDAVIFAVFTKVCRVFCYFLPWFSAVPNYYCLW